MDGAEQLGFLLDGLGDHDVKVDRLDLDDVGLVYVFSDGDGESSLPSRALLTLVDVEGVRGIFLEGGRVVIRKVGVESARMVIGEVEEVVFELVVVELLQTDSGMGTDDEVFDVDC